MSTPAERRRYPRFEIELTGRIGPKSGEAALCVVRDYCQGGLLVEQKGVAGKPLAFETGQEIRLEARIQTVRGEHPFGVNATISWVHGAHLGVSFANPSSAIVEVLRQHRRPDAAESPGGAAAGSSEARALARLRHTAKGLLPGLLRELMSQVAEVVLASVDKVGSDTEQHQLFSDMSAIDSLRRDHRLVNAVLDRAGEPPDKDVAPGATQPDELSLIDPDEFERWLEASQVATMLDREFSDQLGALGSRLAALRGDKEVTISVVPFEPQHFTSALKGLAADLEFCATTRRLLFDCARDVLLARLGGLYAELDAALDSVGAPAVAHAQKLAVVRQALKAIPRGDSGTQDMQADAEPREPPVLSVAGGDSNAVISRSVSKLPGTNSISVDQARLEALLLHENRQREALARQMVKTVADMPEQNERLHSWLDLLSEPMAREAVSDQTFFHNSEHPLREIIDTLGHLQMFRPDAEVQGDDPLDRKISSLLEEIAAGELDHAQLRATSAEIGKITDDHSSRFQKNSERVVELAEGRDRVRNAQLTVVNELNRRYAGKHVPTLLIDLLESGWITVLKLALLDPRDQHDRYDADVQLFDTLVSRLGGDACGEGDDESSDAHLLKQTGDELSRVAFDPYRRQEIELSLSQQLKEQAKTPAALASMAQLHPWPDLADEDALPEGIAVATWQRLLARCDAVAVGDALRFVRKDKASRELRVAWIRDDRHQFVLVDHRGLREREISRKELALGLYRREIVQVMADGRPLSERAVDSLLERMEKQLAHQVAHDSLTGLMNRQQFHAAVERVLASNEQGALLWIDIDQFRLVNDIHGYDTGDRLLIAIARLLERTAGEKVIAHHGGDRFAMLMSGIGLQAAEQRAKTICESISDMVFEEAGQRLGLTASLGLVGLEAGRDGLSCLLRAADNALSSAKMAGGNTFYVYRDDDPDIVRRRESVQWVAQVDDALEHGQLHLRCQPIVPVRPGEGFAPHYEVLLGVASGDREALPILQFIEAAERYNRMRAVDRWVTRTVMEWIAAHRDRMPELHGFAVNLSGQTASDPEFVTFVKQLFQRTGISPDWLSFEVTETAAVTDLSNSAHIVHDLKAMGCKVALDDFGSGLASYSYLKELPVDWLKIDGAFVRKIAADREDYAVVKSINEIGHFLGKQTIAEYVADKDILRLVREIGVDYAQGYEISAPLLLDDLIQKRNASA